MKTQLHSAWTFLQKAFVFLSIWSAFSGYGLQAGADLGVTLQASSQPVFIGADTTIVLTVTNNSPVSAEGVTVNLTLPPSSAVFLKTLPSISTNFLVSWTNITLSPNESRNFTNVFQYGLAGPVEMFGSVTGLEEDPNPANNTNSTTVSVIYSLENREIALLGFPVAQLLYDSDQDAFVAIVGGDHPLAGKLVSIVPSSGLVRTQWNIGNNPIGISYATDGKTAYALTDGGSTLTILERPTFKAIGSFPVDESTNSNATAYQLFVDPSDPSQVVLGLWANGTNTYRLYVDGRATSVETTGRTGMGFSPGGYFIANFAEPNTLNRFQVSTRGFVLAGASGLPLTRGSSFRSGYVFNINSQMFDPDNDFMHLTPDISLVGNFGVDRPSRTLLIDSTRPNLLDIYDLDTRLQLDSLPIPSQLFPGWNPIESSPEGYIAKSTSYSRSPPLDAIAIIRNDVLTTKPATQLDLGFSTTWQSGNSNRWTLTITNSGRFPAEDTWLDLRLPPGTYLAYSPGDTRPTVFNEPDMSFFLGRVPIAVLTLRITLFVPLGTPASEGYAIFRSRSRQSTPAGTKIVMSQKGNPDYLAKRFVTSKVALTLTDIARDKRSGALFTTETNSQLGVLRTFNASPAQLVYATALSSRPDSLAVSENGEFVYVSLEKGREIVRVVANTLFHDLQFTTSLGTNSPLQAKVSLVPLAGLSHSVAISRYLPRDFEGGEVWIYDDDTPRPHFLPAGPNGVRAIQQGRTPDELIGFRAFDGKPMRLTVDKDGIAATPFDTEFALPLNRDFFTSGSNILVYPGEIRRVGDFALVAAQTNISNPAALAFFVDSQRGVAAVNTGSEYIFQEFQPGPGGAGQIYHLYQTNGPIRKMLSWGTNGIAFITDQTVVYGTITFGDSNEDQIPDWWDIAHGFDPTLPIADQDPDGDGASNLDEFWAGTNPGNATSHPVRRLVRLANDSVRIGFYARIDQEYRVDRSPGLANPTWSTIATGSSTGGYQLVEDHNSAETMFYRIVFLP